MFLQSLTLDLGRGRQRWRISTCNPGSSQHLLEFSIEGVGVVGGAAAGAVLQHGPGTVGAGWAKRPWGGRGLRDAIHNAH